MYMNASYNIQLYMAHSLCCKFPLLTPFLCTYLAPSSCDRNRPPQSQVARKLTPFVPLRPLVPSLPESQPLLGFPGLNVHSIRATSQTQSPVYNTVIKILFFNWGNNHAKLVMETCAVAFGQILNYPYFWNIYRKSRVKISEYSISSLSLYN